MYELIKIKFRILLFLIKRLQTRLEIRLVFKIKTQKTNFDIFRF